MSIKDQTIQAAKELNVKTPRWVYGIIGAGTLAAVGYICWKAFEKSAEVAADVVTAVAKEVADD